MDIVCPIDRKDDTIQKVSAIVAGGSSSGSYSGPSGGVVNVDGKWGYSGSYTTLHGSSQTQLATKLSPSAEPKAEGLGCVWIPIIFPLSILVAEAPAQLYFLIFGEPSILAFMITIPLGIVLFILFLRHFRKVDLRKQENGRSALAHWRQSMQTWDRLYYCHKHDIVFDPFNSRSVNPNEVRKYCGFPTG